MSKTGIALGCVADDFTGASDVASFLAGRGLKTVLFNGIPNEDMKIDEDTLAVVIALKTRTDETDQAVRDSLAACRWLKEHGAGTLFSKYCSTFDSTRTGNIGPIADALLEEWDIPYTILCPALPVNGRKVRDGKLYVNDIPLDESPMRNHPLTPMWDSRIAVLMKDQTKYPVFNLTAAMYEDPQTTLEQLEDYTEQYEHFYVVPDYYEDEHAGRIVELFGDLPLLTGGSGLMADLADKYLKEYAGKAAAAVEDTADGDVILLAGSCSVATLGQIADYQAKGGMSYQIDPTKLLNGSLTEEEILAHVGEHIHDKVLYYTSAPADEVKQIQQQGKEMVAARLESLTANIAKAAVEQGVTRIIVAGGETSGAVTKKLCFSSYQIGSSIAPGVPIMVPMENEAVRLVLKSGNFGQPDFFSRAVSMTGKE